MYIATYIDIVMYITLAFKQQLARNMIMLAMASGEDHRSFRLLVMYIESITIFKPCNNDDFKII